MAEAINGFKRAGGDKKPPAVPETVALTNTNPNSDPRYTALLQDLQKWHRELLQANVVENPALLGDYLGKMRLNCNKLFAYMNVYIDEQVEQSSTYARKRQDLYDSQLKIGKSPSASDKHAGEMTRVDGANLEIVKLRIQQIKNEYERYNGICLYLQSRMKEFNTERMVG